MIKRNKKIENKKLKELISYLKTLKSVVVCYSGGVDSTFLLKSAVISLGRENVFAVIEDSILFPDWDKKFALKFLKKEKIKYKLIKNTQILNDSLFKSNPTDRCYYCKKHLFSEVRNFINEGVKGSRSGSGCVGNNPKVLQNGNKWNYILTATNYSDKKDIRPGLKAEKEENIISPLSLLKFTKEDIREASKELKIEGYWRASSACLASRIPFGEEIDEKKLKRVLMAEKFLRKLNINLVRVRLYNGSLSKIEVGSGEENKIIKNKERIINYFRRIEVEEIHLDLLGYKPAGMRFTKSIVER